MLVGTIGYLISAITFIAFFGILLTDKHKGATKSLVIFATLISAVWSLSMAYQAVNKTDLITPQLLEFVKDAAWIALLFQMISHAYVSNIAINKLRIALSIVITFAAIVTTPVIYQYFSGKSFPLGSNFDYILSVHLTLNVLGIVLIEQLYRNAVHEQRWIIKYICLGLGGMFLFDFYMYSDGLLYKRIDLDLWNARGYVDAMIVPVISISIMRDPLWAPKIFISRRVVFHTTTLLASAIYLMIMGTAGYYVKEYGGTWGHVGQAFLLFITILLLSLLLLSKRIRAVVKVLVNKHFYPYKYDYREEWLRFIKTLSATDAATRLNLNTIQSIAQIIDSPGGMLWLKQDGGYYQCVEAWNMPTIDVYEPSETSLPKFLEQNEFVISVDEYRREPELYNRLGYLDLPLWINELNPWLIVPLIHIDRLIGFIVLDHADAQLKHFNWEDSDLLKTAARQAASYIAHRQATKELAVAKQFEEFNKMSTYVIHDIKNLITQLSLITSNAEKHKDNPLFMNDVINTISNSVNKMNTMMGVLQGKKETKSSGTINIVDLLKELALTREKSEAKPVPHLGCESQEYYIKADRDQLMSIFGHLIQNAQDATPDEGSIDVIQTTRGNNVVVEIKDTGCGMDEDFIKAGLFKPFKTTKGDKGMGIGAYETREIITALGGEIDVTSAPGAGTSFKVILPGSGK